MSEYESLFGHNPHMIDAVEWIYMDILMFHQRAIRFFHGNSESTRFACVTSADAVPELQQIFRAMWKNYDTEFQGILKSLGRHKDLVERRASVTQYRRYQEDMVEIKASLEKQISEEREKKIVIIRDWLAFGQKAEDDHRIYQETRTDNVTTAKWILKQEYVNHWIEAANPATPCKRIPCSIPAIMGLLCP